MNPCNSAMPFKPVSKADAAEVLGVSTKTIDNYIKAGLLPAPRPFGGRDLWHPHIFFARLHEALMPAASAAPAEAPAEPPAPAASVKAKGKTARRSTTDSSPMVRQRQREAERLRRLNGLD